MSERGDVVMSEDGDPVSDGGVRNLPMSIWGMLGTLPGMFMSRQVFLFPMLLRDAMGMGAAVLQFGGSLVVLVM